jgi:hypothetical protein
MDSKKKVQAIKPDAIMDIKVSGTFYQRVQALFFYLSNKKDPKEFLLHYAYLMKGNEPKSEYEYHLNTVLSLLVEIEKTAKETNNLEERDMPEELSKLSESLSQQYPQSE